MELSTRFVEKISYYRPDLVKLAAIKHVPLLFLVGIAGAGKNALLHLLLQKYPTSYHFVVSHTTRAPRTNNGIPEQNGVDYHFIDIPTLERMVDDRDFIEVQVVHAPKVYGTSVAEVQQIQAEGKAGVADIDIQGADAYVKMGLNARLIFILPPSFEEWLRRFRGRYGGEIPPQELTTRLKSAVREFERVLAEDHFYLIVNDNLDRAAEMIHCIAQGKPLKRRPAHALRIATAMLDKLRTELAKIEATPTVGPVFN